MENTELKETEIKKDTKLKQSQIAGAIIIAGLLIAGAILLKGDSSPSRGIAELKNVKINKVLADEHILGNPNAKVMIVEYSDTECPWCKVFHSTMHQVIENNNNVAWVFRHYPIAQLHPKAEYEAIATECAWEQGGNDSFWKYTDEIFARTPSNNKLEVSELSKIAGDIGLNLDSFNTCLTSEKYKEKITTSIANVNALEKQLVDGRFVQGGLGTPASFIIKNGKIVEIIHGAEPLETVMKKIEKALE